MILLYQFKSFFVVVEKNQQKTATTTTKRRSCLKMVRKSKGDQFIYNKKKKKSALGFILLTEQWKVISTGQHTYCLLHRPTPTQSTQVQEVNIRWKHIHQGYNIPHHTMPCINNKETSTTGRSELVIMDFNAPTTTLGDLRTTGNKTQHTNLTER